MGLADCINLAGLAKILEKQFKRKLGPLPDTLKAGACVFPPFQNVSVSNKSRNTKIWVVLWLFRFRSAHSRFPLKTGHLLRGHFWEFLVFRLHSKLARSILALKLSVTTTNTFCGLKIGLLLAKMQLLLYSEWKFYITP